MSTSDRCVGSLRRCVRSRRSPQFNELYVTLSDVCDGFVSVLTLNMVPGDTIEVLQVSEKIVGPT